MFDGIDTGKLTILLIFGLPIVAVIGGVFLEALKIITGNKKNRDAKKWSPDETAVIQQIHQGLQRMEQRIEAVETIVLDKAAKEDEKVER
jgi:phage shock protein B